MQTRTWALTAVLLIGQSGPALAVQYNTAQTTATPLNAGDSIVITSGNSTALSAGIGAPALNISGGGISLENSSTGSGGVLSLSNGLNNSLGTGSQLTRSGALNDPASITLTNSNLQADYLTFSGGYIYLLNGAAVDFSHSQISGANRYVFTTQGGGGSITLSDSSITHTNTTSASRTINGLAADRLSLSNVQITSSADQAISVDRGAPIVSFNDVTVRHTAASSGGSQTAIFLLGEAAVTGQNLDVQSNVRSLYVAGGINAVFTGTNTLNTQRGTAVTVFSTASGTAVPTHFGLSNATVTSGNSQALLVQGDKATAMINNSTVTGPWPVYAVEKGHATLTNSRLQMVNNSSTQTFAILANSGAQVDLQGNNSVSAVGNNLAMLASDSGQITASGQLQSSGRIHAQNAAQIRFDLSNSLINAQITSSNGGLVDWTDQGSTWNVLGNSTLNNLTLGANSIINKHGATDNFTVTVSNLVSTGSGANSPVLKLKANTQTLNADLLQVTNSSAGSFLVDVPNDASEANDGLQMLDLIKTSDGAASFTGTRKVEKGGYYYTVARSTTDPTTWQLIPTVNDPTPSTPQIGPVTPNPPAPSLPPDAGMPQPPLQPEVTSTGRGAANIAMASHLLNYASQQSMVDRLSAIRLSPTSMGNWLRVYHGKIDLKNARVKDSDLSYTGLQFGHDRVISESANATWLAGAMLEYIHGSQHYRGGENKLEAYSAALYVSNFHDNGLYFDGFLKYALMRNAVHSTDSNNQAVKGHDNTDALTLSGEVGRTVRFAKSTRGEFFVQPQVQLTASQIGSHSFKHSNGLRVKAQSEKSVLSRVGVNVGYQFAEHPSTLYLKLDWMKEFDGDVGFSLNGNPEHIRMKGDWLEVGVGAQVAVADQQKVFFEAKASNNSQFREKKINFGYRWNF